MSKFGLNFVAPLFAVLLCCSATLKAAENTEKEAVKTLVDGNTAFAVKLFRKLSGTKDNLFFSPYSISSALAMTYSGARGNTAIEMNKCMDFLLEQAQLHPAFKNLKLKLEANAARSGQKLTIANGLCLTGGNVDNKFKDLLVKNYGAELFKGDVQKINNWVKSKTQGKIKKILETLGPNSVCVLLNAIYFKGTWASEFDEKSTHKAPFKLNDNKEVKVSLMYQKSKFKTLNKKDFQIAELPYKGKLSSMIILLPRKTDGLAQLEKQLSAENLKTWLSELGKSYACETKLYLPKFKLETSYNLVGPCKALGMNDAFDANQADFSGMGWPKGELWISQIKHKAFVEVNEEGTEAAAATAVVMETKSIRRYPVFRADHPFLFLIVDKTNNAITFMGKVVNPSK
jgi:serine protease inhibitor